jgi:hypothetical protein
MIWSTGLALKTGASKEAFEYLTYLVDFNNHINASRLYNIPVSGIPQIRAIFDDPAKNRAWVERFHPDMARLSGDILQNGSRPGEQMTLKNFSEIMNRTLVPSWDKIWLGTESAEQVLGSLHQSLQGMLQGVYR